MKKNTFKKPTITYDPIVQPKQPLWMHSIDKPVTHKEEIDIIKSFIVVLFFFAVFCIIAYIKFN